MKVTMLMAMTLDGRIAKNENHFPDWTGKDDKKLFVTITKQAGVIIMGSKTFDTFGHPLPGRKNIILTRNKARQSEWDNLVYTDQAPADLLKSLEQEGYEQVILAGGAVVNSLFARENLIDEIMVTVAPKIFGQGISLFTPDVSLELEFIDAKPVGEQHILLTYRVLK